eukprot:snap_masked-scaffold_4-processed-gene-11.54-mRNA-1 protein AED:1.00 eAED:1.00 QI:0/-1/0/0/-1/1/1/0/212
MNPIEKEEVGCFAYLKKLFTSAPAVTNPRYEKTQRKTQISQQKVENQVEFKADVSPAVVRKMQATLKKRKKHLSEASKSEEPKSHVFNTLRRMRRNTSKSLLDDDEDDPLKPTVSQKYVLDRKLNRKQSKRSSRMPKENNVVVDDTEDDVWSKTKTDNIRGSKISIVRVDSIDEMSIPETVSEASVVDNEEIFRMSERLNDHFLDDMLKIEY